MRLSFYIYIFVFVLYTKYTNGLLKNPDTIYTTKEKEAIVQLRNALKGIINKDYQNLDSYLVHSLRRKNLNVAEAKKLIIENIKWRKEKNIDTILQEKEMIDLEKRFPISVDGEDKFGRPILSYIVHKWDSRRFILAGKTDLYRRYHIYIIEKIFQKVYEKALSGKDVSQYIILMDLSGFNARQHACIPCLQGLSDFVPLLDSRYTNTAYQVIFVNAPRSFEAIINIVRGLLPPHRRNIFSVYGYDKNEWRAHLAKNIDDEQLSIAFGGNRIVRQL